MSAYEGAMSGGAIFLTHHANTYKTICINSEKIKNIKEKHQSIKRNAI